jgi:hypothetical protein
MGAAHEMGFQRDRLLGNEMNLPGLDHSTTNPQSPATKTKIRVIREICERQKICVHLRFLICAHQRETPPPNSQLMKKSLTAYSALSLCN